MEENKNVNELNEALKGMWDSLTEEQKEKAKQCKSTDELTVLAGQIGVELPDEMLDAIAGGIYNSDPSRPEYCPYCNRKHVHDEVRLKDMITPEGESTRLMVEVHTCKFSNRIFYYSSARNIYYDNAYRAITLPTNSGCG